MNFSMIFASVIFMANLLMPSFVDFQEMIEMQLKSCLVILLCAAAGKSDHSSYFNFADDKKLLKFLPSQRTQRASWYHRQQHFPQFGNDEDFFTRKSNNRLTFSDENDDFEYYYPDNSYEGPNSKRKIIKPEIKDYREVSYHKDPFKLTVNSVKQWDDTEYHPRPGKSKSQFDDIRRVTIPSIIKRPSSASSPSFNYDENSPNGPPNWGKFSKVCETGKRQSPIALKSPEAIGTQFENPLRFDGLGRRPKSIKVENNGHSGKVSFNFGGLKVPRMHGGPLNKTYIFDSFHYHWGRKPNTGTEHELDGQKYASELHIVTYNSEYQTVPEASQKSDGLSVLGFLMFEEPGIGNETALPFFNSLASIVEPDTSTEITNQDDLFSLKDLINNVSGKYFTYDGSLTTPDCNEAVTWIVFTRLLKIFPRDLKEFRQLKDHEKRRITKNCRPLQDLNNRNVFTNV